MRGLRDGDALARERRRITVAEIARIVDAAGNVGEAVARPVLHGAQEMVLREPESVTMQELCAGAEANGVNAPARPRISPSEATRTRGGSRNDRPRAWPHP